MPASYNNNYMYAVFDSLSTGTSNNSGNKQNLNFERLQVTRPHTPSRILFLATKLTRADAVFSQNTKAHLTVPWKWRTQVNGIFIVVKYSGFFRVIIVTISITGVNKSHACGQNAKFKNIYTNNVAAAEPMPICHIHYFIFICLFYYSIICSQLFSVDHIYLQRHCKIFVNETLYFFCIWHSRNSLRMLYAYETIGI